MCRALVKTVPNTVIYFKAIKYFRPQIKPPQIASHDRFPGIRDRDCDLFRENHSKDLSYFCKKIMTERIMNIMK